MNINTFTKKSQDYLSNLLSSSSFDLESREDFAVIAEPYDLNGSKYQIFPFKKLTGYLPDPEKRDEPVLYTFYILQVNQETKEAYLEEVHKMRANQDYDKSVIGAYYANFVPGFKPFDELAYSLGIMLEEDFFPGKNYKFAFHVVTITKDYDIAIVYLQLNSINSLESRYPGEQEITFKI